MYDAINDSRTRLAHQALDGIIAAVERWREDDKEYEHYTDSGGKSGGQKEKLAYTVLAVSLAYQFGLESDLKGGAAHSRTFRFVVIDEAFGRGFLASAILRPYGPDFFSARANAKTSVFTTS
jgi:uncharacterized protein YPO0396